MATRFIDALNSAKEVVATFEETDDAVLSWDPKVIFPLLPAGNYTFVKRTGQTTAYEALPPPVLSPADVFLPGDQGAFFDVSDITSMNTLVDGSGVVPSLGEGVQRILDKSGNNNHAVQGNAQSPDLQQDAGGNYFLRYNGNNDQLTVSGVTITQPFTFIGASRYRNISGQGDLYRDTGDNAVSYTNASSGDSFNIYAGNVLSSGVTADTSPHVRVDIFNGPDSSISLDGVRIASGNAGALPLIGSGRLLYLGRSSGATPAVDMYSTLFINRVLDPAEISDVLGFFAGTSGATIS